MTMFISTKIIMTTGMTERTFSKNRMLICICTCPSPMITRTCRNCIIVMIIRSREEHGVRLRFAARGVSPLETTLRNLHLFFCSQTTESC